MSTFAFEVDERECIVVCALHPTKYVFIYRYLTIIIFLSRKQKSVCGLSKPDSTTWDQSGKRLHNNITVGCGHERNFHGFRPGETMK